jgi:hypothetical protein
MMLKTLRILSAVAVAAFISIHTGCDREEPATTVAPPEAVQGAPLIGETTAEQQSAATSGEGQNLSFDGESAVDPFAERDRPPLISAAEKPPAEGQNLIVDGEYLPDPFAERDASAGADLAAAAAKAAEDAKKRTAAADGTAATSGDKPATAAEATDEALAAHKARIASQPMPKALPGYEPVRFDRLAGFVYLETPPGSEPVTGDDGKAQPVGDEQIPAEVMALDGKKVTLRGHMIPIDFHKFSTNEFILVQAVPDCYFCSQPMPNEWIEVKTKDGSRVAYAGDEPVTVAGTLRVGAIFKGRYLESLYRLELDQLVE